MYSCGGEHGRCTRQLRPDAPRTSYGSAVWCADDSGVLVACDADTEFQHLCRIDVRSGELTRLTSDIQWDVEEVISAPGGRVAAFAVNADGCSDVYLLDTVSMQRVRIDGVPMGVVAGVVFDWSGERLAFSMNIHLLVL